MSRENDGAAVEDFAAIYERYFVEIYRYIAGRLGRDVADDLAAETFLVAYRKRDRLDPARGHVRPWLYGIATILVGQHRRQETRRYRALARAGGRMPGAADRLERREMRRTHRKSERLVECEDASIHATQNRAMTAAIDPPLVEDLQRPHLGRLLTSAAEMHRDGIGSESGGETGISGP